MGRFIISVACPHNLSAVLGSVSHRLSDPVTAVQICAYTRKGAACQISHKLDAPVEHATLK